MSLSAVELMGDMGEDEGGEIGAGRSSRGIAPLLGIRPEEEEELGLSESNFRGRSPTWMKSEADKPKGGIYIPPKMPPVEGSRL